VPLLVALDEYEFAMRTVALHAQLGLEAGPLEARAALSVILAICQKTEDTVAEVLSHPRAVSQASALEFITPGAVVGGSK
jgi:hypothetical protein